MQSKEFYKQAEGMAKGWGATLKNIDLLRKKVDDDKPISIKEAMYINWAESRCSSSDYVYFEERCNDLGLTKKKLLKDTWIDLFRGFILFREEEGRVFRIRELEVELKTLKR